MNLKFWFCWIIVVSTIPSASALAQLVTQQTVQLPTFHYTGVSTTVVVPTRSVVPMATVSRFGSVTPFDRIGSREVGRERSATQMSMSATLIDNSEIDRALLAEAARRRGDKFDVLGRPVDESADPVAHAEPDPSRATKNLLRAEEAARTGLHATARILYRRVVAEGSAHERRLAEARLARLAKQNTK